MTTRRWAVVAAVLAACVLAGCSSSNKSPRDDRARVRSKISAFAADLKGAGLVSTTPTPVIAGCGDGHSVNVQWAAPVSQHNDGSAAKAQYATEQNVAGQAAASLKLDTMRSLSTGGNAEVAQIFRTTDGKTMLLLTVPHGQYVRIDGYASC